MAHLRSKAEEVVDVVVDCFTYDEVSDEEEES